VSEIANLAQGLFDFVAKIGGFLISGAFFRSHKKRAPKNGAL
jgi:hypothetical protein